MLHEDPMRKEKQHLPEKQPAEKALDRQSRKEIPVANILRLLRKSNNTQILSFDCPLRSFVDVGVTCVSSPLSL
jgi:hypothetical protein